MTSSPNAPEYLEIRRLKSADSIRDVLVVVEAAAVKAGVRYPVLVPQTEDAFMEALAGGACFLGFERGVVVGLVTYHRTTRWTGSAYVRQPHVGVIRNIAVEPGAQQRGVGAALLSRAETEARADGARELAVVLPDSAVEVMDFFEKRGYRLVEETDATQPHFSSVIFSKFLGVRT